VYVVGSKKGGAVVVRGSQRGEQYRHNSSHGSGGDIYYLALSFLTFSGFCGFLITAFTLSLYKFCRGPRLSC